MNCTKPFALAAALVLALGASAQADQSTQVIQYHPFSQPTIYCAAGLLCEIRLAKGERITNPWNSEAPLWAPSAGITADTPVFVFKPETSGLIANVILTTDAGRDYHIMLKSYTYNPQISQAPLHPLYTRFAYDDEAREIAKRARRHHVQHHLTVAQQMDFACAQMPNTEQYGTDPNPSALRPEGRANRSWRSVCHDQRMTYIQMPAEGPAPTDIPDIVDETHHMQRIVNYTYDPRSRIFRIDNVANEYALIDGHGRHAIHLRIQRQVRQPCAKRGRRQHEICAVPMEDYPS